MKVPQTDTAFWALKLLTTCIGETTADYLSEHDLGIGIAIGAIALVLSLWWQFRSDRYRPVRYWLAVLMVAVVGTALADGPRFILGIPFFVNAIVFAAVLVGLFVWWYAAEGTLSIHSIVTRRREAFYWAVVMVTFGLGTALGDALATDVGLGYFASIFVYGALFAIPLVARRLGASAVACFWCSYTMTRPTGASVSDWLSFGPARGGLGLGTGLVSLIGLSLFALLLAWAVLRERARA